MWKAAAKTSPILHTHTHTHTSAELDVMHRQAVTDTDTLEVAPAADHS